MRSITDAPQSRRCATVIERVLVVTRLDQITTAQRRALEEYAQLKIAIEELRERLRDVLEFTFTSDERRLSTHYGVPNPGIRIELRHIQNAMDKHARGEMTTRELSDWAAMLLMNDAYDWEGSEEEQIAEWLNEIALLTLRPKAE
jgi:hypothetical protein